MGYRKNRNKKRAGGADIFLDWLFMQPNRDSVGTPKGIFPNDTLILLIQINHLPKLDKTK